MKTVEMRAAMIHRIDCNIDSWRLEITAGRDYYIKDEWAYICFREGDQIFCAYGVKQWRVSPLGVIDALNRIRRAVAQGYMDEALAAFYQPCT